MLMGAHSENGSSAHRRGVVPLPRVVFEDMVRRALQEDLGQAGDLTTESIVDRRLANARIVARTGGSIAGVDVAALAFELLDPALEVGFRIEDGCDVTAGTELLHLSGPVRAILSAERTALNFLGHLSGISTLTSRYVQALAGLKTRVACTRKTTPGLRALEKYAVRCGGGSNHRFSLGDAILIKDNHLAAVGSIAEAVGRARRAAGHTVKIELEVDTLEQLEQALAVAVDIVLLDNMDVVTLREAVGIVDGRAVTEASGGVTLETVRAIAETGVDYVSVGALTHSAPCLDVGLDM